MRLIQISNNQRKVGIVEGSNVFILSGLSTIIELAQKAIDENKTIEKLTQELRTNESHDYNLLLHENQVLTPIDHPEPEKLWVTGTGLTHLGSAAARDKMHKSLETKSELTDTMKMFSMGIEGGKGTFDQPGVQPEWFYKGNGHSVIAPGKDIPSPHFALDGGEEAEIVGIYLIGKDGIPYRIGFAIGNEFSDHQTERINYLYLAHSKLRYCSFGPEILLGELPAHVNGKSRIIRNNETIWEEDFLTGELNMSHSIANLEYHHFKYDLFRKPGDIHCHFFGTATISFSKGINPEDGDLFEIESETFGKPLRNKLSIQKQSSTPVKYL